MFSKILIANRAEIAVRIMRACREMGIKTVAVYSEADSESLHVAMADEKVCIGKAKVSETYINKTVILQAAKEKGAEAIHPGYGYLAEDGGFAKECQRSGIVFIGPTPENLHLAGDKLAAKEAARKAGVPVIPGNYEGVSVKEEAISISEDMGYPVIIKASGGGGGRGMRICHSKQDLMEEFVVARAEAKAAFGNDTLYIEKYISSPKHIEFQILADKSGNVIDLGERECTVQRRYQKLIEESPSPIMDERLRQEMSSMAIMTAKAVDYFNAGTVEFLFDNEEKKFYFMEINARVQVEHPVTEMVTGVDIVKEQIRLAGGAKLGDNCLAHQRTGWAIECRINAEDPDNEFFPSPGRIETCRLPGGFGVRLDTHVYQGYAVPPFYDSLIAKLIAHGPDRESATRIMSRALDEFVVEPVKTTIPLHKKVMEDPEFAEGKFDTSYVRKFLPDEEDDED